MKNLHDLKVDYRWLLNDLFVAIKENVVKYGTPRPVSSIEYAYDLEMDHDALECAECGTIMGITKVTVCHGSTTIECKAPGKKSETFRLNSLNAEERLALLDAISVQCGITYED